MLRILLLAVSLFFVIEQCQSARILGVISVPSYSHHAPFHPFWRELALRGHQVTVLTTHPMNDTTIKNLKEINMIPLMESFKKNNILDKAANTSFKEALSNFKQFMEKMLVTQFTIPEVKQLYDDKNAHFDLVICEALMTTNLVFAWRFNAPAIGIVSLDATLSYHSHLGNPTHPLVSPDHNLSFEDSENMTFFDRLTTFYFNILTYVKFKYDYGPASEKILREVLDPNMPSMEDLMSYVQMLFIGTHPILQHVRPLNPNTIIIGSGIHIAPPKPLPNELKDYLDKAKEGAIYFSLGSNVKSNVFSDEKKMEILKVFRELPYRVIVKGDWPEMNLPDNVKILKWTPQQDILRHPNVKLFITQGGLQSLQETLTYGVPVVAIPFFGDQFANVEKVVKHGYGVKVDKLNITYDSVKEAILTVTGNPKYRQQAVKIGKLLHDQPMNDLEKAVWWTEYVLRNKGADVLHTHSNKIPLYQYYFLDIIGFTLGVLSTAITLVALVIYIVYRVIKKVRDLLCRKSIKLNKNKKE